MCHITFESWTLVENTMTEGKATVAWSNLSFAPWYDKALAERNRFCKRKWKLGELGRWLGRSSGWVRWVIKVSQVGLIGFGLQGPKSTTVSDQGGNRAARAAKKAFDSIWRWIIKTTTQSEHGCNLASSCRLYSQDNVCGSRNLCSKIGKLDGSEACRRMYSTTTSSADIFAKLG